MSATQLAALARTSDPHTMLRRFLALDAAVTGANGLVYLLGSGPVGRFLGVGSGLLLGLGAFLVAYGVVVGVLASRGRPRALAVRAVAEANLLWSGVSCAALGLWLSPSTVGAVWTVLQAVTVAGFALLQYAALKARQDSSV